MRDLPQDLVEADLPEETLLRCRFPKGEPLHCGRQSEFRLFVRNGELPDRIDGSPVLRSILERLREEAEDLIEVFGDHHTLHIRTACPSAIDHVLRHVVIVCRAQGRGFAYSSGRPIRTVRPRYALA